MKKCELSKETQDVLKKVLRDIEWVRQESNRKQDYPPSDYPYRPCQAIVAELLGFEHRAEWATDDFLGFEAKI